MDNSRTPIVPPRPNPTPGPTGGFGTLNAGSTVGVLGYVGDSGGNEFTLDEPPHAAAVLGVDMTAAGGTGVCGQCEGGRGVAGFSTTWQGVYGYSRSQAGVVGESDTQYGVYGISHSPQNAGVTGQNDKGGLAGLFGGNVLVTGTVTAADVVITGGDFAEDFDVSNQWVVDPGTVMVLNEGGTLQPSQHAYDKKVAGVVSGAGQYKPGIILDRQASDEKRLPVALIGKVCCKVDADYSAIEIGDLLTTSPTLGHAMKAVDCGRAFGSVIGKALRPLASGQGLVPILIALQ
jgi:hypothetical protein